MAQVKRTRNRWWFYLSAEAEASGSWWFYSVQDPRWSDSGKCKYSATEMPEECRIAIEMMRGRYGVPPSDLTWGVSRG